MSGRFQWLMPCATNKRPATSITMLVPRVTLQSHAPLSRSRLAVSSAQRFDQKSNERTVWIPQLPWRDLVTEMVTSTPQTHAHREMQNAKRTRNRGGAGTPLPPPCAVTVTRGQERPFEQARRIHLAAVMRASCVRSVAHGPHALTVRQTLAGRRSCGR